VQLQRKFGKQRPENRITVNTVDFIGLINWIDTINNIKTIENIENIANIERIGVATECSDIVGNQINLVAGVGYEIADASPDIWLITHLGYHAKADGYKCFYRGINSTLTTKRALSLNGTGLVRQTLLNPFAIQSTMKLWLYSSVDENNFAYDFGYVKVAIP
jgi:hypothetical protein